MILLKNIIFIFLLIFLFGCGSKVDIENVIKLNLNDPDSVKFKQVLVSKDAIRACTIWNAKNGLGGYGNWKITELRRTKGAWEVSNNEMDPDLCTEDFYKLRDELRDLEDQLLKRKDLPDVIRENIHKTRNLEHEHPELIRNTLAVMKRFAKSF